jgi:hypothetical protein
MKKIILVLLLFGWGVLSHAQQPVIKVSHKVLRESVVFEIRYCNTTKDSLAFWIQNWRMNLLTRKTDRFFGFPYHASLVNFFVLMNDSINFTSQLTNVEYSSTSGGTTRHRSIKVLPPGQDFVVELTSTDKRLIEFAKSDKMKAAFICSFSKWTDVKGIPNIKCFLYDAETLTIERLALSKNSSNAISSKIVKIGGAENIPADQKLYYRHVQKIFQPYFIEGIAIR